MLAIFGVGVCAFEVYILQLLFNYFH